MYRDDTYDYYECDHCSGKYKIERKTNVKLKMIDFIYRLICGVIAYVVVYIIARTIIELIKIWWKKYKKD